MKRAKKSPAPVPTIDDFRLTGQQRDFHDAFVDGETKGNAYASAMAVGYTESSAKSISHTMVPASGSTTESIRSAKPCAQAIFWTLHARRKLRDEITTRVTERTIEREVRREVITKEYVESSLREIVERCMCRTEKIVDGYNRDLGERLAAEIVSVLPVPEKDRAGVIVAIADKFRTYAARHHVFKPTQAKEALKLLGVEIGMFQRRLALPPDTPVDKMGLDELLSEQKRLEGEYAKATTEIAKKGNGHGRPKAH